MSFCDTGKPEGTQFLGAVFIDANEFGDSPEGLKVAIQQTWALGINPGGQVMSLYVSPTLAKNFTRKWFNRLLTREECEAFDNEAKPNGVS